VSNPAPTIPTLLELDAALTAYDELQRPSSCVAVVRRLAGLIRSGDVALLSRGDRRQAVMEVANYGRLDYQAWNAFSVTVAARIDDMAMSHLHAGRRLLQLDPGTEAP
jgi:hypothetical protein